MIQVIQSQRILGLMLILREACYLFCSGLARRLHLEPETNANKVRRDGEKCICDDRISASNQVQS